jgi:trimeric autotransporter adhesin
MNNSGLPRKRHFALLLLLALSLALAGCGGGSSSSTDTVTISKITVTPATANVTVGSTQQFYAAAVDSNNNSIAVSTSWTSSSPTVASINASGIATGLTAGTTQISASAGGVTSNTVALTVAARVTSITIAPLSSSVKVGATQQFTAVAKDSSGNVVTAANISWACSFVGVATVDTNGLVTGVSPGTVTIVASVGSVTSQPAALTVTP